MILNAKVVKNIKAKLDKAVEDTSDVTDIDAMEEKLQENNGLFEEYNQHLKELKSIDEKANKKAMEAEIQRAIENGPEIPPDKDCVFIDKAVYDGGTGKTFEANARAEAAKFGVNFG